MPPSTSSPIRFHDRMSPGDAVLWSIESDPALRSTIVCTWLLAGAPDPVRFERKLARCVAEIPRLRQRPVADPLGLALPTWEDDPHFDLAFHLRRVRAPGAGSERDLLDLAAPIGMQAFDRDRPLWELYVVDGLEGGRTGIVMKLHHAVSDGVGLVRMTEGLIERSAEPDATEALPVPPIPTASPADPWTRTRRAAIDAAGARIRGLGGLAGAVTTGLAGVLTDPLDAARTLAERVASVGRLVRPVTAPRSPLMTGRSLSVRYDRIDVPLEGLRAAAAAVGGTLNDAFVSAVAGGLRAYHAQCGRPVETLRMNMPINVRSGERARDAGNQFVPVRFEVPVGIESPAERMRAIHDLVVAQRAEPALPWLDGISAVIGALPGSGPAMFSGAMMKAVDFTTSNVPGPRFPVYVSGSRVERMFGFGPLAGAALNVTCFSYDGLLGIGINLDPAAVTDPPLLVECLRKGFDEVLAAA